MGRELEPMAEAMYRRELDHSYMMIRSDAPELTQRYGYRMMVRNRIRGLLPCQERCVDGESWLYYDISSRQPLERLYEGRKMNAADIGQLLESIAAVQADMGEYLLDGQGLLLEPAFLFADVETEDLYFCFYPDGGRERNCYAALADFLLEHADHGQEAAVNLAYQFYKLSKSEYFVLSSFLPYLEKEPGCAPKEADQEDWSRQAWSNVPAGAPEGRSGVGRIEEDSGQAEGTFGRAEDRAATEIAKRERRPGVRGGWLRRLANLLGRRGGRGRSREERPAEEVLWDTDYEDFRLPDTGDTVYFSDLEKPAEGPVGMPCLLELESGQRIFLERLPVTVGKLAPRAGIVLRDASVSRVHARFYEEDGIWLLDLNSRNGTAVNGRKLAPNEAVRLAAGDEISFGRERFRFGFIDSKGL